jgi:hypothetical protein
MPRMSKRMRRKSGKLRRVKRISQKSKRVKRISRKSRKLLKGGSNLPPTLPPVGSSKYKALEKELNEYLGSHAASAGAGAGAGAGSGSESNDESNELVEVSPPPPEPWSERFKRSITSGLGSVKKAAARIVRTNKTPTELELKFAKRFAMKQLRAHEVKVAKAKAKAKANATSKKKKIVELKGRTLLLLDFLESVIKLPNSGKKINVPQNVWNETNIFFNSDKTLSIPCINALIEELKQEGGLYKFFPNGKFNRIPDGMKALKQVFQDNCAGGGGPSEQDWDDDLKAAGVIEMMAAVEVESSSLWNTKATKAKSKKSPALLA